MGKLILLLILVSTFLFITCPVKALPLEAGLFKLEGKTYELEQLVYIPSNCHIKGVEGQTIIKSGNDMSAVMITQQGSQNITIENIIFEGNGSLQQVAKTVFSGAKTRNLIIKNCTFRNLNSWHLLELNGAKDVRIENCTFEGYAGGSEMLQIDFMGSWVQFPWAGFIFDDTVCNGVTITGCTFIGRGASSGEYAIGNHSFKAGVLSKNITITDNTFKNLKGAVNMYDVQGCTITGNRATGCSAPIYTAGNKSNTSTGVLISNNN